jgi:hypothetical protein
MSQNALLNYVTSPHNTQLAKNMFHIFRLRLMDGGRLDVSVSTIKKHIDTLLQNAKSLARLSFILKLGHVALLDITLLSMPHLWN